jgi:hypothetical protein
MRYYTPHSAQFVAAREEFFSCGDQGDGGNLYYYP